MADLPDFEEHFVNPFVRVEPRCRADDLARGVQARTADPLWMLGRQWQTGELQGEDAGSPVHLRLRHSTQPIEDVRLGAGQAAPLGARPLETTVEEEARVLDLRERARIGQMFEERLLARLRPAAGDEAARAVIAGLRSACPFPGRAEGEGGATRSAMSDEEIARLDRASQRFVRFLRGRVVDGLGVLRGLRAPAGLEDHQAAVDSAAGEIPGWRGLVCSTPASRLSPAWQSSRLSHRFELNTGASAGGQTHLVAPDYRNGEIDWHTFDAASPARGVWRPGAALEATPTRLRFTNTSPRWWSFEDGRTDLGDLDVDRPDLAKLLLMELVLIHADDWFSVPLTAPVGALVRIDEMTVTTVFGDEVPIGPARAAGGDPSERFELFTLSPAGRPRDPGAGDFLFIPPPAGFRIESPPVDEVCFARDEGANMVWGIEQIIPNGIGRPVSGHDAALERLAVEREAAPGPREGAPPPRGAGEVPRYRLASPVPENWIPFVPSARESRLGARHPRIQFRRAQMLRGGDLPEKVPSRSRILALEERPLLWLDEESVLRAGVRVQLTRQRVRWVDGTTHVWLGRKVLTGRGEAASGLAFDRVDE